MAIHPSTAPQKAREKQTHSATILRTRRTSGDRQPTAATTWRLANRHYSRSGTEPSLHRFFHVSSAPRRAHQLLEPSLLLLPVHALCHAPQRPLMDRFRLSLQKQQPLLDRRRQ